MKKYPFTIDEIYPGMPDREDIVHVCNLTKTSSSIKYELVSIKVFGKEVLSQLKANGGIKTDGNTSIYLQMTQNTHLTLAIHMIEHRFDGEYVDDEINSKG